jgi:nucleotide-binding universal stress UspA family protein
MQAIREQGILRYFEGRTETDLYLWISEHRVAFQRELGWSLAPEAAATKLAAQIKHRPDLRIGKTLNLTLPDVMKNPRSTGQWRLDKLVDRYTDRLFGDILVPLRGDAVSWCALDQALHLAQREQSRVHGLHVVASEAGKNSSEAQALRAEFERRLDRAGIAGSLGIEVGEITPRICERAIVTDLVILNLAHPPAPGLAARLGSKIQTILRHCARPVLFVPCTASWLNRAVLAYDGSAKSREALFVAAYLAEHIKIPLVVVSVTESNRVTSQTVEYARQYLEVHEVTATFVEASGPVTETILKTVDDYNGDLLIMGGQGHTPVLEAVLGSSVDAVLRDSSWPVLVCR